MVDFKRVWILDALREAGLSLNRLAQEARASQGALHKLLHEEGDIGLRYVVALHRLTGMPLDEIAERCGHDLNEGTKENPPVQNRKFRIDLGEEEHQPLKPGECRTFRFGDGRMLIETTLLLPVTQAMGALTQINEWARASTEKPPAP